MSLTASIALSLHLGIAATNEIHPAVWYQHEGWKTGSSSVERLSTSQCHALTPTTLHQLPTPPLLKLSQECS